MGKTSVRVAAYVGHESGPGSPRSSLAMSRRSDRDPNTAPRKRHLMSAKTSEQARNEQAIRSLYSLAEGNAKNTSEFVSRFTDDGYFYDVSAGKKYFGREIGVTVDVYAAAFPDMHRELYSLRSFDDHVLVELSLNGTHKGDLVIPPGTISATGKEIHAPCCDVFHLKDGKVFSFHCYVAVPILLEQLGVFMNLQAALRR